MQRLVIASHVISQNDRLIIKRLETRVTPLASQSAVWPERQKQIESLHSHGLPGVARRSLD